MTLKPGDYVTRGGLKARVRRLRPLAVPGSSPTWLYDGAVLVDRGEHAGVWCQLSWDLDGSTPQGARHFDIPLGDDIAAPEYVPDNVVQFPVKHQAIANLLATI